MVSYVLIIWVFFWLTNFFEIPHFQRISEMCFKVNKYPPTYHLFKNLTVRAELSCFVHIFNHLRPKLITYLQPLIEVNPTSISIHISIFYLRPYIISQISQCGYIIGTLKHKLGLKLRWRMGKNGLRLTLANISWPNWGNFKEEPSQEYPKPASLYEEFDDSVRSERCL
jgi:hypothetical protein